MHESSTSEPPLKTTRFDEGHNMANRFGGGLANNWFDQIMDPTRGWWKSPTGDMVNRYTDQRMSEGEYEAAIEFRMKTSGYLKVLAYAGGDLNEEAAVFASWVWVSTSAWNSGKNLNRFYPISEGTSVALIALGESARQTSKITFLRGTATKTAVQITKENAILWGKAAVKLNVLGGTVGVVTSGYSAIQDFSQGNNGWGMFNTGKAVSYFIGTALIFVPIPGARIAAGYILTTTAVVDVGGSIYRNR
jgi:hypothetical protein